MTDPVFYCPPHHARIPLRQCESNRKRAKKDPCLRECRECPGVAAFGEPMELDTSNITPVSQIENVAPKRVPRGFLFAIGGANGR